MQKNKWKFYRMICTNKFSDYKEWDQIYRKIPIFSYIEKQEFVRRFLFMDFDHQGSCLWAFSERYKDSDSYGGLQQELDWLKDIQNLLIKEADRNKGKLSRYRLESLNKEYLNKAIETLENLRLESY